MKRFPVPLVALAAIVVSTRAFTQTPPAGGQLRPGTATPGAQVPGLPMPPRDTRGAPQTGTAKLRGRVVGQTGSPLRRAQISVTSAEGQVRRVTTTDGDGRYEFVELPAGRYSVSATKAGFVTLQYGQRRPFEAGTPVILTDAQTLERIDFTLPRGSVIAGRITDEFAEPIAQAQAQAQRFTYGPDGQRRLTTTQMVTTDDRGEFRLYGLMPGEYVVSAAVRANPSLGTTPNPNDSVDGFSPTFYPGTINSAEAQPISLGVGEETSVQFSLVSSRMSRISGTVVDSEGRPAAGAQIMLLSRQGLAITSISTIAIVGGDGVFTVTGVPAGEHTLEVRPQPRPGAVAESASVPIDVGTADISGLKIVTSRGTLVTGRVIWEGTAPRTNPLSIAPRVMPTPADPSKQTIFFTSDNLANGTLDDDGNFQLGGVFGRVFLNVPAPPGWMLKSVTLDGDDVTDTPLDVTGRESVTGVRITLTDKLTSVTGTVTRARGDAVKDYVVVLLPAEQKEPVAAARWTRVLRPGTDGRFETRGLRPGRYVATAIESLEQGRQFAPEFQQELRRGAREFSVREGQSVTLDLPLTEGL